MRSIFQAGISHRDSFMGQALSTDANALAVSLNDAMNKYNVVSVFAAKPNYKQLLGTSADSFDYMKREIDQIYADVIAAQDILKSSSGNVVPLTENQGQEIQDFINITQQLYAMVQKVPSATSLPAAGAAAATSNTTLLVGGGIAAGLVVLALALKG